MSPKKSKTKAADPKATIQAVIDGRIKILEKHKEKPANDAKHRQAKKRLKRSQRKLERLVVNEKRAAAKIKKPEA